MTCTFMWKLFLLLKCKMRRRCLKASQAAVFNKMIMLSACDEANWTLVKENTEFGNQFLLLLLFCLLHLGKIEVSPLGQKNSKHVK